MMGVPRPAFSTDADEGAYRQWKSVMGKRLKARKHSMADRDLFLQTLWYESKRAGLEPAVVLGLIEVASNFEKSATNEAGARGFMLVAARWSNEIGDGDTEKLFQTQANLRFGCILLRHYLDLFHGDLFLALTTYRRQSLAYNETDASQLTDDFAYAVFASRKRWV